MHYQIKEVIRTLKYTPTKVVVRLTAGEQTPLGNLVERLYYNTNVLAVLSYSERTGYPHNGGQHTLELHCAPLDVIEMLELIKEVCLDKQARTDEERRVASELSYVSQQIHTLRCKATPFG